jgi:hypothetical protein
VVALVMAARNAEEEIAQKAAKIAKSQRGCFGFHQSSVVVVVFVLDFPALPFWGQVKYQGPSFEAPETSSPLNRSLFRSKWANI